MLQVTEMFKFGICEVNEIASFTQYSQLTITCAIVEGYGWLHSGAVRNFRMALSQVVEIYDELPGIGNGGAYYCPVGTLSVVLDT